jgi:hypothetical protein
MAMGRAEAAEVVERAGVPAPRDLRMVMDHGDGHPVSAFEVDDAGAAARALRAAFPRTGYWPLVLLDDLAFELPEYRRSTSAEMAARLAQGWRREDLVTGEEAVALAAGMALDDAPYCGFFGGRPATAGPPGAGDEPPDVVARPHEAAVLGEAWTGRDELLLVPVEAPWEALAHIGFGARNESPADAGHVRFQRHLAEEYGGAVVAVGTSRMNVELTRPPRSPDAAFALAGRLFEYCRDLETVLSDLLYADPDEEDLGVLLAGVLLAGVPALPLWWD